MTYTCFSLSIFWRRSPCCRLSSSRVLAESSFAFDGSYWLLENIEKLFWLLALFWLLISFSDQSVDDILLSSRYLREIKCVLSSPVPALLRQFRDILLHVGLSLQADPERIYIKPASHTSLISGCICICICIQPVPRNFSTSGCQLLQPTGSLSCPARPVWSPSSSRSSS